MTENQIKVFQNSLLHNRNWMLRPALPGMRTFPCQIAASFLNTPPHIISVTIFLLKNSKHLKPLTLTPKVCHNCYKLNKEK